LTELTNEPNVRVYWTTNDKPLGGVAAAGALAADVANNGPAVLAGWTAAGERRAAGWAGSSGRPTGRTTWPAGRAWWAAVGARPGGQAKPKRREEEFQLVFIKVLR
jgi:hypothetical protein